jgi:MFS family permease
MTVANAGTVRRTKVAKVLTEVFAPPILVVTLLVVVGIHSTSSISQGLLLSAVAAFFAAGLPYAIMLIGIRRGRLSDRHLSRREQRPAMMIIGLMSVSVGLLVMAWLDAPREFLALVAAMVAGVGVALAISSFWKISIHAACAAGSVAILVIVFGWVRLDTRSGGHLLGTGRTWRPHRPAGHSWRRGGRPRRGCGHVRPRLSERQTIENTIISR